MRNPDGRWEKFDDYVLDFALDRMRHNEQVALVTLANIEGTAPRPRGAQMAISQTGEWVGYLSGGCIERAVVAEALAALDEGKSRYVRYGRGSKYLDIQLPCGSAIDLHFDVDIDKADLATAQSRLEERNPASLQIGNSSTSPDMPFIRHYRPRRRLIVVGIGPGAVQLAKLARSAGFATLLQSPDELTRSAVSEYGIETIAIAPGRNTPALTADAWTAIVFMFHDHEWERELIPAAIRTDAFYIGAMGSRRAHLQRLEMLKSLGMDDASLARIRGPAGLFAGAKSAPDVAISILAEIVQVDNAQCTPLIEDTGT
ncbi:XdhC family protein [Mesorhizobium australicum]|uniref:Xanthine dehydrogenase accessory factor n=1 Tax=Mesorhizobium australicum TaxID=536018 RepID=A0A1X7MUI9_9HYPH|nr:XdhC family protein [Mesorhizobium australicum]SMH27696.1 xanthine dehydrogenase accessory factor [Mesorhizobium australicum]